MAQTQFGPVDLATLPLDGVDEEPTQAPQLPERVAALQQHPVVAAITIRFREIGGRLVPEVSCCPVGRVGPNHIDANLPFIYRAIQQAQREERKVDDE